MRQSPEDQKDNGWKVVRISTKMRDISPNIDHKSDKFMEKK